MKLRAYSVQADEKGCVVFAETRGQAKSAGVRELECEWTEIQTCKLAPQFNEYCPGPVPVKALLEDGWYWECAGCGRLVTDDPGVVFADDQPLHSEECRVKYEKALEEVKESNRRREAEREAWIAAMKEEANG
jgi:hypothetical protein